MKKSFGINYPGSKNATAEDIVAMLPAGRRLVDLFGGGGSITHAAAVSGKYESILYRDKDQTVCNAIQRIVDSEPIPPLRFISRQEFEAIKGDDVLCTCFNFSGKNNYGYNRYTEILLRDAFRLREQGGEEYEDALRNPEKWAVYTLFKAGVYNLTDKDIKRREEAITTANRKLRAMLVNNLKEHGGSVQQCVNIVGPIAGHYFRECQFQIPTEENLNALIEAGLIHRFAEYDGAVREIREAVREVREAKLIRDTYNTDFNDLIKCAKPLNTYSRIVNFHQDVNESKSSVAVECGDWTEYKPEVGDVIYMDPPYMGRFGYANDVAHKELAQWIRDNSDITVFVSEMSDAPWVRDAGLSPIWSNVYGAMMGRNATEYDAAKNRRTEALFCNECGDGIRLNRQLMLDLFTP